MTLPLFRVAAWSTLATATVAPAFAQHIHRAPVAPTDTSVDHDGMDHMGMGHDGMDYTGRGMSSALDSASPVSLQAFLRISAPRL